MNSYVNQFLKFGIPVIVVMTLFLSLLLGPEEGLIPGLLSGLLIAGFISLILGFLFSKSTQEAISEMFRDRKPKLIMRRALAQGFLPLFILLIGAFCARLSGKLLLPSVSAILISASVYIFFSHFFGELEKAKHEGKLATYFTSLITLPFGFALLFFLFLFSMFEFDFDKIRGLF